MGTHRWLELLGQEVSWNEVRKARQAAGQRSPFCLPYLLSFTLKVRAWLNVCILWAVDARIS